MDVTVTNENDVEQVKTGRGYTKFLVTNKRAEGSSVMIRIWGPETNIEAHSHDFNEMFYVLDGEVTMGENTYTQGACIYIPKGVEYGPTTAPKGVRLLRYVEGD
jgi:quercetin dioxygenase-like cupin family protein